MAAQATVNERIDLNLSAILGELESLPDIERDWPDMPDDHQVAFLLEWDEMMSRLEGIDRAYRSHRLTSTQLAQYQELLRVFELHSPVMVQLGLTKPQIAQVL